MSMVTDGRLVAAVELLSGRSESATKMIITDHVSEKPPYLLGTSRDDYRTDLRGGQARQ
jgi:hypothetical protein